MASNAGDILTATEAVITGLALTPAPTVRRRKRLALHESETPPLIFTAAGDGERVGGDGRVRSHGARPQYLVGYPVSVGLVFKARGLTGDNPTLRGWREAIRGALLDWYGGLRASGLPQVNDVEAEGRSVFDAAGLDLKSLDWSEFTLTVEVWE